jgi:hypothetical protein
MTKFKHLSQRNGQFSHQLGRLSEELPRISITIASDVDSCFKLVAFNYRWIITPTIMRVIRNTTSGELLTKQAIREKKLLHTKNRYVLKLILNVVTAGIETLVSGNKFFCTPVSKKPALCDHSHVLKPSINASLLLKRCDCNQLFR